MSPVYGIMFPALCHASVCCQSRFPPPVVMFGFGEKYT